MTNDIVGALQKVRQGHIEYKMDRTSIVHVGLGKVPYSYSIQDVSFLWILVAWRKIEGIFFRIPK